MSDGNLFAFGCVVSFIALAGFYVYARERFTQNAEPRRVPVKVDKGPSPESMKRVA
jgi:hypothetical protein